MTVLRFGTLSLTIFAIVVAAAVFVIFPVGTSSSSTDAANSMTTASEESLSVTTQSPPVLPARVLTEPPKKSYFVPEDAAQSVKDALEDGIVTFAEYTSAVRDTLRCISEKGIEHSEPVYNEAQARYTFSVASDTGPGEVSAYDACWMKLSRDVEFVWAQQNQAMIQPEVMNEKGALECAANFGLKADTFQDIIALKRASPRDVTIQHCYVIGTDGFDPSMR